MDMLPKDDVADMRDAYDVMTPDETRESETKRLKYIIMQTPAIQSSVTGGQNGELLYGCAPDALPDNMPVLATEIPRNRLLEPTCV